MYQKRFSSEYYFSTLLNALTVMVWAR